MHMWYSLTHRNCIQKKNGLETFERYNILVSIRKLRILYKNMKHNLLLCDSHFGAKFEIKLERMKISWNIQDYPYLGSPNSIKEPYYAAYTLKSCLQTYHIILWWLCESNVKTVTWKIWEKLLKFDKNYIG